LLSVEDWAEIRRLHRAEGLPIKTIARTLRISRNTVRAALASAGPPKYERKPTGSAVDAFEDAIRGQLFEVPTMPATVIAERVGWTRGMTVFKERVRELRPAYLPPDPASRTTYEAGDIAQCDLWFPPTTVPVGFGQTRSPMQLPVLTMVCGYSRWLSAILISTRRTEDLFAGWWRLIHGLGAVPRTLVWDGEGAIGRWRSGKVELTADCQAFRGVLGAKVVVLKPDNRNIRASSNAPTTIWSARFFLAGPSPALGISTTNCRGGCSSLTGARAGCWAVRRSTGSARTAKPCSRCRRSPRPRGGARRPGWLAITTCGWTPTTTRCTPA
jgi:transposase